MCGQVQRCKHVQDLAALDFFFYVAVAVSAAFCVVESVALSVAVFVAV